MISIYKPYLPKNSLSYAHDALDSTWLSSSGKYLSLVQEKLQELLNIKYVLPLNNGTSATHLVAKCLSKTMANPYKKRIIVPDNVYVAAWNSFLFDNDYQLIPVETDIDSWNYDLNKLDAAIEMYPSAAVLIVHNIGNIINVPELQKKYPWVYFVEDNCEGFLGKYNNQYSGTSCLAASISFFGNKNITSGEGGALLTNNENLYLFAKCIQGQGQSEKRFIHNELGYNYRMTNVQAAILCGQIDILPFILQLKQDIFDNYKKAFSDCEEILMQSISPNTNHSNWMFGIRIPGNVSYDETEFFFKNNGIEIRPMFYSIATHQYLKYNIDVLKNDCTNADILNKECFILPSYPELTVDEQNHVIKITNDYVKGIKK